MKLYDDGNTGIALGSGFVETHAGNLHVYEDRTQAGDIVFITADNFKKYVPIEWIKQYWDTHRVDNMTIWNMLNAWEKENEENEKQIGR